MSLKLLYLTLTILGLIGCSGSKNDIIYNQQRRSSSAMGNGQRAGVDTAKERVQTAKDFLVQLIVNSEATVFEHFPEGFTQDTLVQIVKSLSFSGDERFRSGQPILMDHVFEDRKLFYTQQFVAKFGHSEADNAEVSPTVTETVSQTVLQTLAESNDQASDIGVSNDKSTSDDINPSDDPTADLLAIKDIVALVLQELSHLMNLGRTQQTKNISVQFAANLMDHLLAETVLCEGHKDNIPFSLAMNPQTGMSFYVQDKTIADYKQPTNYQVARPSSSDSNNWSLGSSFPFFELQGEEARGALEVVVNKLNPEMGVPLHSSYELIEIFQGLLPGIDHVIFWSFQESVANQTYRMNYRPEQASARASIEEIGAINFNLQNLSEARLSIEVQKNNVLDENQSLEIPMNCEQLTSVFDLQTLLDLNASLVSASEASVTTSTQTNNLPTISQSLAEEINVILQQRGCNRTDLSAQEQRDCIALSLMINAQE